MRFMGLRYAIQRRSWIISYSVWSILYDIRDGYLLRRIKRWFR